MPVTLPLPPLPRLPLRAALRLAPDALLSQLMAMLFTHLLRGQALAERLSVLDGKRVSLLVSDLPCELRFRVRGRRIVSGNSPAAGPAWDVRIRGAFDDFWLMASGGEDPDTLFFQRRLAIEGDTECGLILKNLLDALEYDWPAHVTAVLGPLALWRPSR